MSSIEEKDKKINELQIDLKASIYARISLATDHYLQLSHATTCAKAALEALKEEMTEFHETYGDRRGVTDRKDIFEGQVSTKDFMVL